MQVFVDDCSCSRSETFRKSDEHCVKSSAMEKPLCFFSEINTCEVKNLVPNSIIEIAQQCPSISFMYLQVKGICCLSTPDLGHCRTLEILL